MPFSEKRFEQQPPSAFGRRAVVCSYVWAVGDADCRWQSFCDLTESADENRPLQFHDTPYSWL